jgi:hypothetical protein
MGFLRCFYIGNEYFLIRNSQKCSKNAIKNTKNSQKCSKNAIKTVKNSQKHVKIVQKWSKNTEKTVKNPEIYLFSPEIARESAFTALILQK